MVPLPAAVQPRPQSHRNGLRQAQGPFAKSPSTNHRGPLASRRLDLRTLLTRRMPELPQGRWICCRLNARRSSTTVAFMTKICFFLDRSAEDRKIGRAHVGTPVTNAHLV